MAEAKKAAQKKPAAKKATTKKAADTAKKAEKKFENDTPIMCKSVTYGELIYKSKINAGQIYRWPACGDVIEVPYQEIQSMKNGKARILYFPSMIIMDEDLMATDSYSKEFGELYKFYDEYEDPVTFFSKSPAEIKEQLRNAPDGLVDLIKAQAGDMIERGALDSIGVINAIDEVLKTQLKMNL